jgi:4-phytase/acid phosphatase
MAPARQLMGICACVALFSVGLAGRAAGESAGDEMQLAIVLTRHGVRSPLLTNEQMASLAAQPWPKWEVAPGIQTPRGDRLIALMGDYYRARFLRGGLLSGDPARDAPLVFVRADNDQRTIATGRILGRALLQGAEPDVNSLEKGVSDPLFRPLEARVGHADPALAAAAVLGRMGGDPRNMERAFAPQLAELEEIMFGPGGMPPAGSPLDKPTSVVPGENISLIALRGRLKAAAVCTESLLLEYTDGMPASDVGWGRADGKALTDLLTLHELSFDLTQRTRYPAQVEGSNLASHIIDTLEQAALGQPLPGALGPSGERIVVLVGHDTNIANIGGLLDLSWWIPGTQANPLLPGGALVFELWKRGGDKGGFYVRLSYVAQTLEQMRDASPLSLENPPARSPIFIPGCSGPAPDFDAPLPSLVRQARRVIDPAFVN